MKEFSRGYSLFTRPPSGLYYMRYSIRGQGQQRLSLGTKNADEAEKRANKKWLRSCALADAGVSVSTRKFSRLVEEFVTRLEQAVSRKEKAEWQLRQYPPIMRKYFVGFFGHMLVANIRTEHVLDYWEWRKQYWSTGPGSKNPLIAYERTIKGRTTRIFRPVKETAPSESTLRKEALLLRQIFEFGVQKKYITEAPDVQVPKSKKREKRNRPGFTLEEFRLLKKVSEDRVRAYEAETGKNQRVYVDRMKLHCFCMIAGYTGMRPTELFNLSWGDIDNRKVPLEGGGFYDAIIIQARGKGKEREMVAMPETLTYFSLLHNLLLLSKGEIPKDDDPVFFR